MSIKESELNAINSIQMNDFVRAVTHANSSSRVLLSVVAQAIVENYAGSSLGGGTQSIKDAIDSLKSLLDSEGVIEVASANTFNYLPITLFDSKITDSHVVVESVLSNPTAQTSDWTVTTSNGSVTIDGTISGDTNITLILDKKHGA